MSFLSHLSNVLPASEYILVTFWTNFYVVAWFLPGVKQQGLRELRVVLVVVLLLVLVMWCFYLPGHLTTTFVDMGKI